MKRAAIIFLLVAGTTTAAVLLGGKLFATPPESVELPLPALSPSAISPNVPTFVTFAATLSDPDLRAPKLQIFDPVKGQWRTIKALKDDGKAEDLVKDDRVFTKRLWFLDATGTTQIGFEKGNGDLKVSREVTSPAHMRLIAKRKGQRTLLISPTFEPNWRSIIVPGSNVSLRFPATFSSESYSPLATSEAILLSAPDGTGFIVETEDLETTPVDVIGWADSQEWPFAGNDWRSHFQVVTIAGVPALRDPLTGSITLTSGNTVVYLKNGFGRDASDLVGSTIFESIVETLQL